MQHVLSAPIAPPPSMGEHAHRKSADLPPLKPQGTVRREPMLPEGWWVGVLVFAIIVVGGVSLLSFVLSLFASAIRSFSEIY
ncbi:hypothetical protein PVT71_18405 [Salipiger sp. H15]|uniref:Uncharacterized protein n=1 Tax=Alloyangia sp. H15 TaxID=3029062 RepID=A0AAU8AQ52_9RHOB